MNFLIENKEAVIFSFLFFLSEVLSLNPRIKANGVFQLVFNALHKKSE